MSAEKAMCNFMATGTNISVKIRSRPRTKALSNTLKSAISRLNTPYKVFCLSYTCPYTLGSLSRVFRSLIILKCKTMINGKAEIL